MFNYNIPKPQVVEVDNTVRNFDELRNINGQNYITITATEGRKLMQRIQTQPDLQSIERVLAKGHDNQEHEYADTSNKPDFILIESKDYVKKKQRSQSKSVLFSVLRETSALQFQSLGFYQAVVAEFIGVYILTLVVCGLGLSFDPKESVPSINGCLGGGLTLATMIWCTNCISGIKQFNNLLVKSLIKQNISVDFDKSLFNDKSVIIWTIWLLINIFDKTEPIIFSVWIFWYISSKYVYLYIYMFCPVCKLYYAEIGKLKQYAKLKQFSLFLFCMN